MSHPTRGGFFYLPKRLRYSATPKTNLLSRCASVKSVFVSERRISRFGQPIAVANHLQMSCVKDMVEPLLGFCAHLPRIGPLLVVLSSGWDVLALFKNGVPLSQSSSCLCVTRNIASGDVSH